MIFEVKIIFSQADLLLDPEEVDHPLVLRLVRGDQDEHHIAFVVRRHLGEQELTSNQASFVKVFFYLPGIVKNILKFGVLKNIKDENKLMIIFQIIAVVI